MSVPLPIGLIGCGRVAERLYLPAFAATPEARIAAVVDPDAARRALLAGLVGCPAFASTEEMAGSGLVAAAIVLTPPGTHAAAARPALAAGLPLLIEKPLAATLGEGREIATLQTRSRVPVMVGFNRRWWAPAERLRERLAARASDSMAVTMVFTSHAARWAALSGVPDPLDDLAPHQLDLLRFLFDAEIVSLSARRLDPSAVRLRVRLGAVVAECAAAQGAAAEETVSVRAGAASWLIRAGSDRIGPPAGAVRRGLDLVDALGRKLVRRRSAMRRSFERQLAAFTHAARGEAPPSPGIADGIAALRAVEAARRSAEWGGVEVTLA